MKFTLPLFMASLVAAKASTKPAAWVPGTPASLSAHDVKNGICKDIIFIFARGSTEPGNMGFIVGPQLAEGLQNRFPDKVAVQGVDYPALLGPNFLPGGTHPAHAQEMSNVLDTAMTECPHSIIVTGGYSQGAALVHRSMEKLPKDKMDRIVATVTFGDTQNVPDKGRIPNYPESRFRMFCGLPPFRDLVCDGILAAAPAPPHLSYGASAEDAANFLAGWIRKALA